MDAHNVEELEEKRRKWKPSSKAKIELFGNYHPSGSITVHDPYYDSGSDGFEECFERCVACTAGFLETNLK